MYHKSISFRRQQRMRVIKHKAFICSQVYNDTYGYGYLKIPGKLSKGKIHCSCPLCAAKTGKIMGVKTNSLIAHTARDLRRLKDMQFQLDET